MQTYYQITELSGKTKSRPAQKGREIYEGPSLEEAQRKTEVGILYNVVRTQTNGLPGVTEIAVRNWRGRTTNLEFPEPICLGAKTGRFIGAHAKST